MNQQSACEPGAFFPLFDLRGGDLAAACARCQNEAERALLDAWLAVFRAQPDAARRLVAPLLRDGMPPHVRLGAALLQSLAALALGDAGAWRLAREELTRMPLPEALRPERELALALANVSMHGRGMYPAWIETGAFTGLAPELFPMARLVYVKLLYVKWKEVELLAVAEPLIAESHREQSDLGEIYLRLMAAVAYVDRGDKARAREHIAAAAALARPFSFLSPFLEMRRQTSRVMDECLRERYPEALKPLRAMQRASTDNWTYLYNELWEHPIADKLTPREFQACSLFNRGMEVAETARRMGVSVNTVKKYLSTAYAKLGVAEKSQLGKLMHP